MNCISVNGGEEYIGCNNLSRSEVYKWLSWMRTKSGYQDYRYLTYSHTDNPSIQGVWSPFTHRDPADNIAEFPLVCISIVNCTVCCVSLLVASAAGLSTRMAGDSRKGKQAISVPLARRLTALSWASLWLCWLGDCVASDLTGSSPDLPTTVHIVLYEFALQFHLFSIAS